MLGWNFDATAISFEHNICGVIFLLCDDIDFVVEILGCSERARIDDNFVTVLDDLDGVVGGVDTGRSGGHHWDQVRCGHLVRWSTGSSGQGVTAAGQAGGWDGNKLTLS